MTSEPFNEPATDGCKSVPETAAATAGTKVCAWASTVRTRRPPTVTWRRAGGDCWNGGTAAATAAIAIRATRSRRVRGMIPGAGLYCTRACD